MRGIQVLRVLDQCSLYLIQQEVASFEQTRAHGLYQTAVRLQISRDHKNILADQWQMCGSPAGVLEIQK